MTIRRSRQATCWYRLIPANIEAEVAQAQANLDFAEAQANSAKLANRPDARNHHAQHQRRLGAEAIRCRRLRQLAGATGTIRHRESASGRSQRGCQDAPPTIRAQSDLARYTPLLGTDDVSKYQFDAVDAAARVAKSDLAAAEQQLSAAQQAVEIARANAHSAQARVSRSESQLLGNQSARAAGSHRRSHLQIRARGRRNALKPRCNKPS